MYKEHCPKCEKPLGLFGPPMNIKDRQRVQSRIEFECPVCHCRLERRLPRGEKWLLFSGAVALFMAYMLSLFNIEAQAFSTMLYLFGALTSAIAIRNELVKQRFYLASETSF